MKIAIKDYLLYSSVFAIFTEAFFFNFIIDWKLLYLIILTNYLLLIKIKKLTVNKYFIFLLFFFLVHGLIAYTIIWIPYNYMFAQIIGMGITGIYYYNFVSLYKPIELIRVYGKMSVYVALIGYLFYFFGINYVDGRLNSIFKEPAHYVVVVLPACYYFFKTKKYLNFAIIFGTLILSNSSIGYIGCGLIFLIPNLTLRRMRYLVTLVPVICITFYFAYKNLPFFSMRVDDTYNSLNVINTGKFEETTNLSSYVLISNLFITKKNITDHPLGSGIGSHHYMHTKVYSKMMRPPEYIKLQHKEHDNSLDANSYFARVCSDFGFMGMFFIFFIMYKATKCFSSSDYLFAQGVYVYFLLKLFRDGHYFPPEFFFFVWIFYFTLIPQKENIETAP